MLFNSFDFAIFLPIVFLVYWGCRDNLRLQNVVLLVSSYLFYSFWDWRFLSLLIFSTLLDFYSGIKIHEAPNQKKKLFWLWLSICVNVSLLGVFKYYNFFVESFADGLTLLGLRANFSTLQVMLPIGISFYTFHGLSYVLDLYKNRIQPERSFINYSVFVSFFPLLVAGPIERATHLLPQIVKERRFDYLKAVDGLKQILWGFFKKIVIADNCAEYANAIFNNSDTYSGSTLVLGALFFTFQIYCDFSGYSDIAIGTARLFGIDLLRNFAFPYFSRDIAEFWRRWHISLSSWFKDYVYIPLGGSRGTLQLKIRNIVIIFFLSGLWHGANWTFIIWGLLNALYVIPSVIINTNRNNLDIVAKGKYLPTGREFVSIGITFVLIVFSWIFFRANDASHAFRYISSIFSKSLFSIPLFLNMEKAFIIGILMLVFMSMEWIGREQQYAIANIVQKWKRPLRWSFYLFILLIIVIFKNTLEIPFIYFQF